MADETCLLDISRFSDDDEGLSLADQIETFAPFIADDDVAQCAAALDDSYGTIDPFSEKDTPAKLPVHAAPAGNDPHEGPTDHVCDATDRVGSQELNSCDVPDRVNSSELNSRKRVLVDPVADLLSSGDEQLNMHACVICLSCT